MLRSVAFLALALCLTAPVHAAVFTADFDQGMGDAPEGWKIAYSEGHGIATWEREGYQSFRSLALEGTAENEFTQWVGPSFEVQPTTPYLLTVMLKTRQGAGPPGLSVGGKHCYLPSVTEWTRWQVHFTTPADMTATHVRLYLYHRPGQKVWFDDVSVIPAADVIVPLGPADKLITESAPERLTWQGPEVSDYLVLISSDPRFDRAEHRLCARTTEVKPPALAPGLWHWMVIPAAQSPTVEKQLRQTAEVRSFLVTGSLSQAQADTTPPFITNLTPRPDATVPGGVTISADIIEAGGLAQVEMLLNGKRVPQAKLTTGNPAVISVALAPTLGEQQVTVTATDRAGLTTRRSWRFSVRDTPRPRYRFRQDLNLHRDETEPLFALGLYDYDDHKHLDELFQAGLTYIITGGASNKEEMDRTHLAGLKIAIGVGVARQAKTLAEAKGRLQTGPLLHMLHPALLAYWSDEIEGPDFDPALVAGVQTTVREFDPHHPFLACIAGPQWYASHGANADALWPDVYPVPRDPMTAISTTMDKATAAVQGRRPVWYLIQGFDWSVAATGQPEDGKTYRPTGAELRCMSYLALNHGAKGLGFYAAGNGKCAISRWPERFAELLALVRELRSLEEVFLSRPEPPKGEVAPAGVLDARLWQVGKRRLLVVVNTSREPQLMRVKVPKLKSGTAVKVLCEDRTVIAAEALVDIFAPLAVHIYEL